MPQEKKSIIKYWPEEERQHKRLINYRSSISNEHLRAILIGSMDRRSKKNTVNLSQDLFSTFSALENLNQTTGTKISQIKTFGATKASQIKVSLELGKCRTSKSTGVKIKLKSVQEFVENFLSFLINLKKEFSKVVLLDLKPQLIKDMTIPEGILNVVIVPPREVMTLTIRESARLFALIHNHPCREPIPSQKYFKVTDRLN
jgi:DNA repair protein RadC